MMTIYDPKNSKLKMQLNNNLLRLLANSILPDLHLLIILVIVVARASLENSPTSIIVSLY